MTNIHEQAMSNVYQQVLARLLSFFSRAERTALQLLIQRLGAAAGGMEQIADLKVLAIQTGTRDSCYTLALLRAAQLTIASRAPATFHLRVATLRLNGTHPMALENINRSYSALFVCDDPRVEVLMADNRKVVPFDPLVPFSRAGRESNRLNMLMLGHRRACGGLLDLWDDGYLATGEFYGQITRWNHGVDVLISSDTPRQQKLFFEGLKRAAAKAGHHSSSHHEPGYAGLFAFIDEMGSNGYQRFYSEPGHQPWRPAEDFETCRRATLVDIHDLMVSNLEERGPLLTDFLGFQADELADQLSDNDYVSLPLSAHLRGLHGCFVQGRTYEEGVGQYLQRALITLRRKRLPERLCEQVFEAFGNPATITLLRTQIAIEAQRNLGLSEAQLVCLLFAPFVDNGAALERFLRRCHPGMMVGLPDLHRAMQGHHVADQIVQWLVDVSGLPLHLVCELYRRESVVDEGRVPELMGGYAGLEIDALAPHSPVPGESPAGR
ncbi:MAG: hypothetical protein ACRESJ_28745 [Pseudomonas sp.]|uniref:hypothetical protein n=1 Tax=Pseudomonas sp. TaxID=306 RepID=UPI003D6E18FB